jgi:hypothetical protein
MLLKGLNNPHGQHFFIAIIHQPLLQTDENKDKTTLRRIHPMAI